MKSDLKAIFSSYSEVLFGSGFWLGLLIFAITLVNPGVAIAGLLAVLSAYLFARFVGHAQGVPRVRLLHLQPASCGAICRGYLCT